VHLLRLEDLQDLFGEPPDLRKALLLAVEKRQVQARQGMVVGQIREVATDLLLRPEPSTSSRAPG
jgi:hypothetical protein